MKAASKTPDLNSTTKSKSSKSKPAAPKVKPWDAVSLNPTAPGKQKKTSPAEMKSQIKNWQPGHSPFFR
jgi:hypothetical protein